ARASPHRHLLFRALLAARHRHGAVHAALLRADRGLSRGAALRPAALAVCHRRFCDRLGFPVYRPQDRREKAVLFQGCAVPADRDRKSTRLNSSHVKISYAVFCLKKKKKTKENTTY